MSATRIVAQIDDLYRRAVTDPTSVDDPLLTEWSEAAFESAHGNRTMGKSIRRAIRTARKLAKYWLERDATRLPDWRNAVDETLGGLGWQAQLDVLRAELEATPDPETFAEVKTRHRAVHFTEWMESVSYEEWKAGREYSD